MRSGICRNRAPILGPVITGAPEVNYSYLCLVPPIWTTQLGTEWAPPLSHHSTQPLSRWELCSVLSARCCLTLKETGTQIFHSQKHNAGGVKMTVMNKSDLGCTVQVHTARTVKNVGYGNFKVLIFAFIFWDWNRVKWSIAIYFM